MSKRNNVNPGQYKVAGRDKPGTPLSPEGENKEAFSQSKKQERARGPEEKRTAPTENRKK